MLTLALLREITAKIVKIRQLGKNHFQTQNEQNAVFKEHNLNLNRIDGFKSLHQNTRNLFTFQLQYITSGF